MGFTRAQAVTGFPFELIDVDNNPITSGPVYAYVTIDGGVQQPLSGTPVHEGYGQWSINITADEMDGGMIGLLFRHDLASIHFTIKTDAVAVVPESTPTGSIARLTSYYGSMDGAELYFGSRLNTRSWDIATIVDREKALKMATRAIDRLNFAGVIHDSEQSLQFPRGSDTTVPTDIEYACYEIALALLDGVDVEQEALGLGVLSDAFSGVRTTYDGAMYQDHLRAGIPSIVAWDYLKPYLNDPRQIVLSRVN